MDLDEVLGAAGHFGLLPSKLVLALAAVQAHLVERLERTHRCANQGNGNDQNRNQHRREIHSNIPAGSPLVRAEVLLAHRAATAPPSKTAVKPVARKPGSTAPAKIGVRDTGWTGLPNNDLPAATWGMP
jgi:hypothetical protein